jgi:poly(A) polymerase
MEIRTLQSVRKIDPPVWMRTEQSRAVMQCLSADSKNPAALYVGGCVRNFLMGEEVEDIDIATIHTPPEVLRRLEASGIKYVPTGIEHGTVTAVLSGQHFEITTLRRDVETDGRRAVVAFSEDWAEDAARRDFTINTLLCSAEGDVYDPTGQGLSDLAAGRVAFVGDPALRIAEDYLRILRFFRFHARYGKDAPDEAALKACRAAADQVMGLSAERITQEIFKILAVKNPAPVLSLMFSCGILLRLQASGFNPQHLEWLCGMQDLYGLANTSARLFMLVGCDLAAAKNFEPPLLIPKVFKKDMEALAEVLALPDLSNEHSVQEAVYRHGRHAAAQGLMVELALDRVMHGQAPAAIKIIQNWQIPDFPLTGHDLIARGLAGPDLGAALERLEQQWIESGFSLDAALLLKGV